MRWPISLDTPPEVVALARNLHGFQSVERFLLKELWSLHFYGYTADLIVDGHPFQIKPGRIGICPPGVIVEYRYTGLSPHIYAHFRAPWGSHELPAMTDVGNLATEVEERLLEVIGREASQINSRVWDILWSLNSMSEDEGGSNFSEVTRRTCEYIDRHLSEPLTAEGLAHIANVTPAHLARLFRAELHATTLGHIRRQRMKQAAHLLKYTTLPIKVIAASVGIPDLQHFNKTVRGHFGVSPRELQRR